MAELPAKVTGSYFPLKGQGDANATQVLAVLSCMTKGIGSTQEEAIKASGLEADNALRQLARLEREGFVRSFLCQEGTAGPFARRYRLADGIEIEVKASRPA
ncbi:MAG: hypothetical protein AAB777_00610 [Patescibacteria group bacterium]